MILLPNIIADRNITANSLHPGVVRTNFTRHLVSHAAQTLIWYAMFPVRCFTLNEVEGAQTQIYASVSEELEGVSGKYLKYAIIL